MSEENLNVEAPAVDTEGSVSDEGQEQGQDSIANEQAAAPKGKGTSQGLTAQDKGQLDEVAKLIESQSLPPEVKYMKDKSGKLQFIVPIDGVNYQVSFSELVKGFNINQAGYKRFEEAKKTEKHFYDFIERGKKDPNEILSLLERLGHDKYALAEKLLEEKIKEAQMSDEERKASRLERELEQLKKERAEEKAAAEKREREATIKNQSDQLQAQYSDQLQKAMATNGFDTKSFDTKKGIAKRAVEKVYEAAQKGADLNFSDAVYMVKQEWQKNVWDVFGDIDENHVIDLLPPKLVDAILKASLNRKPSTPVGKGNNLGGQVKLNPVGESKPKKKVNTGDYFRNL